MTSVKFLDSSYTYTFEFTLHCFSFNHIELTSQRNILISYVNNLTRQALINRASKSETEKILRMMPESITNISSLRIHMIIVFFW